MTTDRTQPARPAAPNDRSSAAPAERRDGSAPEHRDARHDHPQDGAVREEGPGHGLSRDAARHDLHAAAPQAAVVAVPEGAVLPAVAQPVVVPPFVATVPAEAPAAAPALPAPPFMVAPEAVVAAVLPVAPQPVVAPTPPAAVAPQPVAPVLPASGQPAATVPTEAAPQPHQGTPAPAPAPAPAQPAVPQAPAAEAELPAEPTALPVAEAPMAPEPEAHAPLRATVSAEPVPAAAPAATAPAAEPVAPSPVSTPLPGPSAVERTVPLYRAPAAVATLLHVAVDRGITHAKMALRPSELGGIEIRLQATAAGVAAQVVADSPEAARLLAQAGDDLRRALEARDVTLVSLEVSTSADQQQRQSARGEWSDPFDGRPTPSGRAEDAEPEPAPIPRSVIELPGGLLVDVLA